MATGFGLRKELGIVSLAEFHELIWFQHVHCLQLKIRPINLILSLLNIIFCFILLRGEIGRLLEDFDYFRAKIN